MSAAENEVLVRRFVTEVMNGRRLDLLEEYLSPAYEDLSDGVPAGFSIADLRRELEAWYEVFPDHRVDIEQAVAADDLVAIRSRCTATHHGQYAGIAGTGRRIEFTAHELHRVRDGAIVQHWEIWDEAAVLRQLGALA